MADRRKANPRDRGGGWFVDTTCIDCDLARQVAPGLVLEDADGLSYFARPPEGEEETRAAWRAVLGCPTGSVGAPEGAKPPPDVYPAEVAPGVLLLGYASQDSFGANAYFVPGVAGGLMVDAPRWVPRLAEAMERMGGVAHVLLTHRDDVADHRRYAERFGARVWIHAGDRDAAPGASDVFEDDTDVAPGVRAVPIPGHTRGSAAFLVEGGRLFTGDSLYWSRGLDDLAAFRSATWYSWRVQTESLARLADTVAFSAVFPGHGGRGFDEPARMRARLLALVERMRAGATEDVW